jgi:APA family basic amino acid/polyamine antiporter
VATVLLCALLMGGLTIMNWLGFIVWLLIGMVIYVLYSRKHSEFAAAK